MAILYRTMKDNFISVLIIIFVVYFILTINVSSLPVFLSHPFDTVSSVTKVSLLPLMLFPPYCSTEAEKERIANLFSRSFYGMVTVGLNHSGCGKRKPFLGLKK